jgi:hypothetical protein
LTERERETGKLMWSDCSSNVTSSEDVILNFDTRLVIGAMDATSLEKGQADSMRDDPWSEMKLQPIDFHLQTVMAGSFWSPARFNCGVWSFRDGAK